MESDFIWMDGELVPFAQANIHVITPTLHYGVGVFEGIRSYQTIQGPAIFRLRDHLERFLESIQVLGITDYPYSIDHIRQAVHDTILANGFGECYIRPLMYLDGPLGLNMDLSSPKLAIATWEWGSYLVEEAQKNRYPHDGFFYHQAASKHKHDEIKAHRKLCQFHVGENIGITFRI